MEKVNGPAIVAALECQFDPRTPGDRQWDRIQGWFLAFSFLYFASHLLWWYVRQ